MKARNILVTHSLIRNPNFPGGRLHHHGGEFTALNSGSPLFHRVRPRLLAIVPFTAIAASSTITPRIEIYTSLACSFLRPEYGESHQQPADILGLLHSVDCRISAMTHQSSCVNIPDGFMTDTSLRTNGMDTPPTRKQRCASDPVVQAAVAKLTTRAYAIDLFFVLLHVHALSKLSPSIRVLKNLPSLLCVGS